MSVTSNIQALSVGDVIRFINDCISADSASMATLVALNVTGVKGALALKINGNAATTTVTVVELLNAFFGFDENLNPLLSKAANGRLQGYLVTNGVPQ